MRYIINGALGLMGREMIRVAGEENVCAKVDKNACSDGYFSKIEDYLGEGDVIVDFSSHLATYEVCEYAVRRKMPLVIASTSHTCEEMQEIYRSCATVPIFLSYNFSGGVFAINEFIKILSSTLEIKKAEIFEKHHKDKKDAPSGTAITFKDTLTSFGYPDGIEILSVREGDGYAEHTVRLETDDEIITIKHEAKNRTLFAKGAVLAAEFIITQKNGLYGMKDLVNKRF